MTPLIRNINSLQSEFIHQWYKSCNSTIRSIAHFFEISNNLLHQTSRQKKSGQATQPKRKTPLNSPRPETARERPLQTGVAVITGGTGGIGTAICKRLSHAGNRIIATHIAAEKEQSLAWKKTFEQDGYDVDLYECDVADFESCREFARDVEAEYEHVDILVNAAGITRDAMLKKMDPEQWRAVIDTDLGSAFNVTRNFIGRMIENRYGRIINISSVNGQKGQFGQTNYSTAKAGMIGFTRSLALELATRGITVNCVCPGYVQTAMVESMREDVLDRIIDGIPMGRLATVEEIANAVAFLADPDSSYITGTELAVNGGMWLG